MRDVRHSVQAAASRSAARPVVEHAPQQEAGEYVEHTDARPAGAGERRDIERTRTERQQQPLGPDREPCVVDEDPERGDAAYRSQGGVVGAWHGYRTRATRTPRRGWADRGARSWAPARAVYGLAAGR